MRIGDILNTTFFSESTLAVGTATAAATISTPFAALILLSGAAFLARNQLRSLFGRCTRIKAESVVNAEDKPKISFGGTQIRKGPVELYHGVGFSGANVVLRMIKTPFLNPLLGKLVESAQKEDLEKITNGTHPRYVAFKVYQHFLAHGVRNWQNPKHSFNYVAYVQACEKEGFADFANQVKSSGCYDVDKVFSNDAILKVNPAERNEGSQFVNWFSNVPTDTHGQKYSIYFSLTTEQIKALERENAGEVSVYESYRLAHVGYFIPQLLPLKYAKEIVVNPDHNGKPEAKEEIEQIEKALSANPELSHIKVVVRG